MGLICTRRPFCRGRKRKKAKGGVGGGGRVSLLFVPFSGSPGALAGMSAWHLLRWELEEGLWASFCPPSARRCAIGPSQREAKTVSSHIYTASRIHASWRVPTDGRDLSAVP